jgi:hypothetical protein
VINRLTNYQWSQRVSIGKRIGDAIDKFSAGDYEGALIPTCVAIDATASQVYPAKKNNEAYKDWLHENLGLTTKVGMGNITIENIRFEYRHPDVRCDAQGQCTIEQLLYHVVRCRLLHSARLPDNLRFGPPGTMKMEQDGTVVLSGGLVFGLIAAVVVSHVNRKETAPSPFEFTIFGKTKPLTDLWGDQAALLAMFPK